MPNKDSFTFSDKLKKSKSLPLSKRIPSRMGPDDKAKRTLIQRAQRDLPFIIVAAAALLLLPVLSRDNGAGGNYPVLPGWDDEGVYAETEGQPVDRSIDMSPGDFQDPLSFVRRPGSGNLNSPQTPTVIENEGTDEGGVVPTAPRRAVDTYASDAAPAIRAAVDRKATEKGNLRNSSSLSVRGSGGFSRNYSIFSPTKGQASSRADAGVRPVALQPMESAGKGGRSMTGEGLSAEAARSIGAMNRGPAKQALFNAQLKDVDGRPMGEVGSGPGTKSTGRVGTGGSPNSKIHYQLGNPWWMDMEKTKYMKMWELWHYNFQKAVAEPMAKALGGTFGCLAFASQDGNPKNLLGAMPGDPDYVCVGGKGSLGSFGDFKTVFGNQTSGTGDSKEEKSGGKDAWTIWEKACTDSGGHWEVSDGSPKSWWDVRLRCLGLKLGPKTGRLIKASCAGVNNSPIVFNSWIARKDNKIRIASQQMLVHYVIAGTRPSPDSANEMSRQGILRVATGVPSVKPITSIQGINNERIIYIADGGVLDGAAFKKNVLDRLNRACPGKQIVVTRVGAIRTDAMGKALISHSAVAANRESLCYGGTVKNIAIGPNTGHRKVIYNVLTNNGELEDVAELKAALSDRVSGGNGEYRAALTGNEGPDAAECKVSASDAVIWPVYVVSSATAVSKGSADTEAEIDCGNINTRAALKKGEPATFFAKVLTPDTRIYGVQLESLGDGAMSIIKNVVSFGIKDGTDKGNGLYEFSYPAPKGKLGEDSKEDVRGEILWITTSDANLSPLIKGISLDRPIPTESIYELFNGNGKYKTQKCYFAWCRDPKSCNVINPLVKGYCTDKNNKVMDAYSFDQGSTWISSGHEVKSSDAASQGACTDVCHKGGIVYALQAKDENGKTNLGKEIGSYDYIIKAVPVMGKTIQSCVGQAGSDEVCLDNDKLYASTLIEHTGFAPMGGQKSTLILKINKTAYTEKSLSQDFPGRTLAQASATAQLCDNVCVKRGEASQSIDGTELAVNMEQHQKEFTPEGVPEDGAVYFKNDMGQKVANFKDILNSLSPNASLAAKAMPICGQEDETISYYCSAFGKYFFATYDMEGQKILFVEVEKSSPAIKQGLKAAGGLKECDKVCKNKDGYMFLADDEGKATYISSGFVMSGDGRLPKNVRKGDEALKNLFSTIKQLTPPEGIPLCNGEDMSGQVQVARSNAPVQGGKSGCKDGGTLYNYVSLAGYNISTGEALQPTTGSDGKDINVSVGNCQNKRVCVDQEGNIRLGGLLTGTILAAKGSAEVSQLGGVSLQGCMEADPNANADDRPLCGENHCKFLGRPYNSVLFKGLALRKSVVPSSLEGCKDIDNLPECTTVCVDLKGTLRKGVMSDGEEVGPASQVSSSVEQGALNACFKRPDIRSNCNIEFIGEFSTASFTDPSNSRTPLKENQVADKDELVRRLKDCFIGGGYSKINMAVEGYTDKQGESKTIWDKLISAAAQSKNMTVKQYMDSGLYKTSPGSYEAWLKVRKQQNLQLGADRALFLVKTVIDSLTNQGVSANDIGVTFNYAGYNISKRFANTPEKEKKLDFKAALAPYMQSNKSFVFDINTKGSSQCSGYNAKECRKVLLSVSPENQSAVIAAIDNFSGTEGCYAQGSSGKTVCQKVDLYTGRI